MIEIDNSGNSGNNNNNNNNSIYGVDNLRHLKSKKAFLNIEIMIKKADDSFYSWKSNSCQLIDKQHTTLIEIKKKLKRDTTNNNLNQLLLENLNLETIQLKSDHLLALSQIKTNYDSIGECILFLIKKIDKEKVKGILNPQLNEYFASVSGFSNKLAKISANISTLTSIVQNRLLPQLLDKDTFKYNEIETIGIIIDELTNSIAANKELTDSIK